MFEGMGVSITAERQQDTHHSHRMIFPLEEAKACTGSCIVLDPWVTPYFPLIPNLDNDPLTGVRILTGKPFHSHLMPALQEHHINNNLIHSIKNWMLWRRTTSKQQHFGMTCAMQVWFFACLWAEALTCFHCKSLMKYRYLYHLVPDKQITETSMHIKQQHKTECW